MKYFKHIGDEKDTSGPHCIVLGAGGARGLAHLGAMRALGEGNFQVSRIVGVSMGALIGGLCAIDGNVVQATNCVLDYLNSSSGRKLRSAVFATGGVSDSEAGNRWPVKLLRELKKRTAMIRAVRSKSLLSSTVLRDAIDSLIPDLAIEDLLTPLQIATVDLRTGQRVVLNSGSLRRAIRASMSIPGVFPPVHHQGKRLSDIGVYDSVPCDIPADHRCSIGGRELVVAVDVGQNVQEQLECRSAFDSAMRLQAFAEQTIRQQSLANSDFVVRPTIQQTRWFDFSDPESIIQAGYQAAIDALDPKAIETNKGLGGHKVETEPAKFVSLSAN